MRKHDSGRKAFTVTYRFKIWDKYAVRVQQEDNPAHPYLERCGKDELPCPLCFLPMKKEAMLCGSLTPKDNPKYWNIDHVNGNHDQNNSMNLQPAHCDCNAKKRNMTMTHYLEIKDDYETGEYLMSKKEYQELMEAIERQTVSIQELVSNLKQHRIKKRWWKRRRRES